MKTYVKEWLRERVGWIDTVSQQGESGRQSGPSISGTESTTMWTPMTTLTTGRHSTSTIAWRFTTCTPTKQFHWACTRSLVPCTFHPYSHWLKFEPCPHFTHDHHHGHPRERCLFTLISTLSTSQLSSCPSSSPLSSTSATSSSRSSIRRSWKTCATPRPTGVRAPTTSSTSPHKAASKVWVLKQTQSTMLCHVSHMTILTIVICVMNIGNHSCSSFVTCLSPFCDWSRKLVDWPQDVRSSNSCQNQALQDNLRASFWQFSNCFKFLLFELMIVQTRMRTFKELLHLLFANSQCRSTHFWACPFVS